MTAKETIKVVVSKTDSKMINIIILFCAFGFGAATTAAIDTWLLRIEFENSLSHFVHKVMYMGWGGILLSIGRSIGR